MRSYHPRAHSVDLRTRPRTARAITRLVINLKTAKVLASTFLWPTCRGSMRNITGSSTRRFAHGSAAAADIVAHGGVEGVDCGNTDPQSAMYWEYQTARFGIRPTPVSGLGRDKLPTFLDIAWQILFRLGFPVARIWWRLQRRRHVGALVAIHVGQSLLLLCCSVPPIGPLGTSRVEVFGTERRPKSRSGAS
jgi:hypothetical protein